MLVFGIFWFLSAAVGTAGLIHLIISIYRKMDGQRLRIDFLPFIISGIVAFFLFFSGVFAAVLIAPDTSDEEISAAISEIEDEPVVYEEPSVDEAVTEEIQEDVVEEIAEPTKPVDTAGTTDLIPVELVKVIDGDTIKVIYDGQELNVRYLLIDTPETQHPRLGKQPFGEEAKTLNAALVNGGTVALEFDVGERMDHYGRLLAYVYVDGVLVQEKLVREGLARVGYVYPPSTRHLDRLEAAEEQARSEKKNIWSIEDYATEDGFQADEGADKETQTPQGTDSASSSEENESFKNCTELRKVYPKGVAEGHPAYDPNKDRDQDGYACE